MAVTWTIIGEASKALDATSRTLAEIGAEGPTLKIAGGTGIDSLTWTAQLADTAGTGALLPEEGQTVILKRQVDAGTPVTVFHGTVSKVKASYTNTAWQADIEVLGAGWWLDRLAVQDDATDDLALDTERPSIAFDEGALSSHLSALIASAAALGAPVASATLPTIYNVPQQTLDSQTYLSALADLIRLCPDLVTWWDYTATPAEFNCARRGSAGVLSLDMALGEVAGLQLEEATELRVEVVQIATAEKVGGKVLYNEQNTEKDYADLTTAMTGSNNDLTITARKPGAAGNSITFGISASTRDNLEVEVISGAITVYRQTGGSTASAVAAILNEIVSQHAFKVQTAGSGLYTQQIRIIAQAEGTAGDGISVSFTGNLAGSDVNSVSVVGSAITIDADADVSAARIAAAINSTPEAARLIRAELYAIGAGSRCSRNSVTTANGGPGPAALVSVANAPGNDGTGNVTTLAATALSGGTNGSTPTVGRLQTFAATGPELAPFLPSDPTSYALVRSGDWTADDQILWDKDPRLAPIALELGQETLSPFPSGTNPFNSYYGTVPALRSPFGGEIALDYYIRDDDPPDWAFDLTDVTFQTARMVGVYYRYAATATYGSLSNIEQRLFDIADHVTIGSGEMWIFIVFDFPVVAVSELWASTRVLRQPGSFNFAGIPSDFAANLLTAQNFLPYRGRVILEDQEADPAAVVGKVVNVSNGLRSAWSSMKALPASIEHDIYNGRTTINLGAPPRVDIRNLARRIGVGPRDNVIRV